MRITLVLYHLYIPSCHSLKEKRSIVKGLKESVKKRLNVSIAEVENQDKWQRSTLAVVWVSTDGRGIDQTMNLLDKLMEARSEAQLLRVERRDLI